MTAQILGIDRKTLRPPAHAGWTKARRRFAREVSALALSPGPGPIAVVRDEHIAALPEAVQRYLRFMGVVGRPRDWSFCAGWTGEFRMSPNQRWQPCEAWQYNSSLDVTRVFHMHLSMGGVLPTVVRDTYVDGRARMFAKVFDVLPVVDAAGPELDMSELVTYLNDAVLIAPSMILGPMTVWSPVDEVSFDVALTDRGRTVTARVLIDHEGAPRDFVTEDRFGNDPFTKGHPFVRARWTTPIDGWSTRGGRVVPTRGRAVWHFPGGPFAYADFTFDEGCLAYNVTPRSVTAASLRPCGQSIRADGLGDGERLAP